jgi:hypothetical protein
MLHPSPKHFVQVVENALDSLYVPKAMGFSVDEDRWIKIHAFYEARYLNPDSPEKDALHQYGFRAKGLR